MILPFIFGFISSMRVWMALTVLSWFSFLGSLRYENTWAVWAANLLVAVCLTMAAVGECVGDALSWMPSGTEAGPATERLLAGALTGAMASLAVRQPAIGGVIFGLLGAASGLWRGKRIHVRLVHSVGGQVPASLIESVAAVLLMIEAARELGVEAMINAARDPSFFN